MRIAKLAKSGGMGISVTFIFVGGWWVAKRAFAPPDYILPSPIRVFETILNPTTRLLHHTGVTLGESVSGFVIGNFVAFVAAIIFQMNDGIRRFTMPIAIALKTTPIVALAPLLLIWIGVGRQTNVISACLICFFPMLVGLFDAMKQTPIPMSEYARSLGASRTQEILFVRLPYAIPEIFAALRVSSTLAVVGAVVGEMISASAGLGYVIIVASYNFRTTELFSAVILTALCGFVIFWAVSTVGQFLSVDHWRN